MTSSRQSNPQYTDEYKLDAVNLARSIGIPAAAQRLGVSDTALRKWDKMVRDRGKDAFVSRKEDVDNAAELRRLRLRVRELEMERDILKKATAFFARENG